MFANVAYLSVKIHSGHLASVSLAMLLTRWMSTNCCLCEKLSEWL